MKGNVLDVVLVSKSVLYDKRLTPAEKVVYFMLQHTILKENGCTYIKNNEVGKLIERSPQRAYQLMLRLQNFDLIKLTYEDYNTRVITLKNVN